MKVIFEHYGGKREPMHERYAIILQKLGRGTYLTRAMQAEPIAQPVAVEVSTPVVEVDDLASISLQELHELAKERGVKVHHNAGAEKVRAALREAE